MSLVSRQIATGVGRCEGPVIRADGEIVIVSMDQGCLYKINAGGTAELASVGHSPNGATEWSDGTIYVTQSGGKRSAANAGVGGIQIVRRDGSVSWLTKDPIAPNDLCFGPDGLLYVTDPTRTAKQDDGRLFRCDIETGETELLCSLPWYPNGIGFGGDDALYVARYAEQRIVRFAIDNGRLGKEETYVQMAFGCPDGFLFDTEGNIVIGVNSVTDEPGQVQTYDSNGKLIDTFLPGGNKHYTNVALGADRQLVITDTDSRAVIVVDGWPHAGLPLYPFRT